MKSILFSIFFLAAFGAEKPIRETRMSDPQFTGSTPRFTTDHQNNPVLSWAEKDGEKATFYFARSVNNGQSFSEKIRVPSPATISVHAEGMPKLAFKADGTILALFEVPRPVPESRFSGDLLYTISADGGKTWSEAKPLHRDATPGKSHSFSDLNRLPNGEIGIAWLDDKMPGKEGRSVKFVQTLPGGGFSEELIVDDNACQCCRTNVFVDSKNQIHLTWRDLLPAAKPGDIGARDISTAVSADGGKTFSAPQPVAADGWKVNACPHTGPVVTQVSNDVLATWFSGKENEVGIRLANLNTGQRITQRLSNRAKHPQVAAQNDRLLWVWDESFASGTNPEGGPIYTQKICLQPFVSGQPGKVIYLSPDIVQASYPAILATKTGVLVAYEERKTLTDNGVIVCRWVENL